MKRLTTDNPKDNIQTALNLFYIKEHETWVRGGGSPPEFPDVSLFDYTRQIIKDHIPYVEIPEDDDSLSMMMGEWLFEGSGSLEGVIATLYTSAWVVAELRHRLAAYEDTGLEPREVKDMAENAETSLLTWFESRYGFPVGELMGMCEAKQQGRHVVLPCKLDVPIYLIRGEKEPRKAMKFHVDRYHIDHFTIADAMIPMITACSENNEWEELIDGTQQGYEYWLSREEAEAALNRGAK